MVAHMKTLVVAILLSLPALAADRTPVPAVVKAACGADDVEFSVKLNKDGQPASRPKAGKALVYVVEQYDAPGLQLAKPTVRVGLDGSWVGANRGTSHLSFSVEPGVHHLCADWQSAQLAPWFLHSQVALTNLTAEAGQTLYYRARAVYQGSGSWTLNLEAVNSDEGRLLVTTSRLSAYRPKK